MHSTRIWLILLPLGLAIVGCGREPSGMVEAGKPSPVGGVMVYLPRDTGLVAIKTEPAGSPKSKLRATKIVAVFFKKDGSTPMSPPPTEVVFELEMLRAKPGQTKTVALEADPITPNRFVSAAGSFPGGVAGKIRAKIDGQDTECPFSAR